MTKRLLHIIFCNVVLVGTFQLNAQKVFQPKPVEYNLKGVVFSEETIFELRAHTQGFAIGFKKGKLKSYYRTTYYGLEFGYIKDGRERRRNKNISISGEALSSAFIYGKRNQLFNLRMSLGEKRYLSEKTRRRGLAVGVIYEGGASLALLKPYYVRVIRTESDRVTQSLEDIKYSEDLHDDFLNDEIIYGGTNFFKGFTELSPRVGLHGKLAMHWALGAFDKQVKAAEAGLMVDIYPGKIPLLVERNDITNSFYFAKLYISFQFGKRKL